MIKIIVKRRVQFKILLCWIYWEQIYGSLYSLNKLECLIRKNLYSIAILLFNIESNKVSSSLRGIMLTR